MKRGIRYKEGLSSGSDHGTPPQNYGMLGYPVEFDPWTRTPAEAKGVFWNKRIVVGPAWVASTHGAQQAMLYHEAKHCIDCHMEKRIMLFGLLLAPLLFLPLPILTVLAVFAAMFGFVHWRAAKHELDADRFAVENGFGPEMLSLVRSWSGEDPLFYPDLESRCRAISEAIKEKQDAMARATS